MENGKEKKDIAIETLKWTGVFLCVIMGMMTATLLAACIYCIISIIK